MFLSCNFYYSSAWRTMSALFRPAMEGRWGRRKTKEVWVRRGRRLECWWGWVWKLYEKLSMGFSIRKIFWLLPKEKPMGTPTSPFVDLPKDQWMGLLASPLASLGGRSQSQRGMDDVARGKGRGVRVQWAFDLTKSIF